MRVLVAGSTGVVGRRTVSALRDEGHEVTALARSPEKAALVERLGAAPCSTSLFDTAALTDALRGHDAVCNLATSIPPSRRAARGSAWADNDRIRTIGSRSIADAASAAGVGRYIQESISFLYADGGAGWIDEEAPVEPSATGLSALDAEGEAQRFSAGGGVGVVLRFGSFYGPDSSHTLDTIRLARRGFAANLGEATGYLSPITTDDAAAAVVRALGAPAGVYNVVDDEPLSRREHFDALAHALGRSRLRLMPGFMWRLGGRAAAMVARSQRVSNRRFKEVTGWSPRYPSAESGWAFVVGEVGRRGGDGSAA